MAKFKQKIIVLLLVCSSVCFSYVKEEDTRTTGEAGRFDYSWFNGYFWTARMDSLQQKTYFILGLGEGIMLQQREVYNKTEDPDIRDLIEKETLKLVGSKYTLTDIIKNIDEFYKSKNNLKVPIADAYIKALSDLAREEEKKKLEMLKKLKKDR